MYSREAVLVIVLSVFIWGCSSNSESNSQFTTTQGIAKKRPNILLIVADDLGYSDIGAFGGEIETPNLDGLAAKGVSFTNFHATPGCATTRASLLTGVDHHLTGIGTFPNWASPNQEGKPGYEGYLNDRVVTLAESLKTNNYATFMVGKWHLSSTPQGAPHKRGFDRAWDYSKGIQDYFALYAKASENGVVQEDYPDDFYATRYMTDKLIGYLEQPRPTDQPFFGYLAFTAPHFALQAEDHMLNKYAAHYDGGYAAISEERLQRMIEKGIITEDTRAASSGPKTTSWDSLTAEQQRFNARAMEIYAAMVDSMDQNIGRIIKYLRDIGQYDNTLVIFISDNGAASVGMETNLMKEITKRLNRRLQKQGKSGIDNSYGNMGRSTSRIAYGSGWAEVGSTPHRLYKHTTSEGGLLVPAIFSGGLLEASEQINHSFVTVMDVMPTVLELTGTKHPELTRAGLPSTPMAGASMASVLIGQEQQVHSDDYVMGWELSGDRAIYQNGWKLVSLLPPMGNEKWELYYLPDDPVEQNNLAKERPEKLAALERAWREYEKDNGVVIAQKDKNLIKRAISSDPANLPIR